MKFLKSILLLFIHLMMAKACFSQSIGLVLSGGGVRGLAHIGVLKALEENNIPIDYITGTSAGALVGSMYASGLSPKEIEQLVTTTDFVKRASGQFDEENLYYFLQNPSDASWINIKLIVDSTLRTQLPSNVVNPAEINFGLMQSMAAPAAASNYNFDSLLVPFRCVASDITAKQPVIFKSGDLALAVRASMAFPFYYAPILVGDHILYDGGIYNNFPTDIMLKEFNPDLIIGVSAAGFAEIPSEGNFLSQLKTMITHTTVYTVPRPGDFLIEPDIKEIGSLSFDNTAIRNAIDSGYTATLRIIPSLKASINRSSNTETLLIKRHKLQNTTFNITIDKIYVYGVNEDQANYIRATLNPRNQCISLQQLKKSWFKLVADDNQRYLFPRLMYNSESGNYDLHLDVKKNKGLFLDFGGNVSSRPINTGYVGMQHNIWGRQSLRINGNIYFGKFYNSGQLRLRMDVPGIFPCYIEPSATLNQWDYYKSSTAIFNDVKPSFLVQYDRSYNLAFGMPARNKAKVILNGSSFRLKDRYYLTRSFSESDTADQTSFRGLSASLEFVRNTLNRKQYANDGTYLDVHIRYVYGDEFTQPGSSGILNDSTKKTLEWMQLNVQYDNYFMKWGKFKIGMYTELLFSGQEFFSTYIASVSSAPSFQPLRDMQTRFLESYHAHNYVGFGLKNVFSFNKNFDIRVEGYIFQPFQEILQDNNYKPRYGEALNKRYFLGSFNPVYYSPIGPVSLSMNYYYKRENPVVLMFHLGYILFNRKALE
jgi:NTE family protein